MVTGVDRHPYPVMIRGRILNGVDMISNMLEFLAFYLFFSFLPPLVLMLRGRGWKPRFFGISFLLAWTGGGWVIMLWYALMDRPANFLR